MNQLINNLRRATTALPTPSQFVAESYEMGREPFEKVPTSAIFSHFSAGGEFSARR